MEKVVHIVPVGHTKETLVGSIRSYPASKVFFILGNHPDSEGERKAREVAKQVSLELGSIPSSEVYVDPENISSAALKIIGVISTERKAGRKVMVNLSGSLRSIGIATYIAALMTNTKAYIGLPEMENGRIIGVSAVVDAPLPPLKRLSPEKERLLKLLKTRELSLDELTLATSRVKKTTKKYLHAKSLISHHLKDLNKDSYIKTRKDGKTAMAVLTSMGELYLEGSHVSG